MESLTIFEVLSNSIRRFLVIVTAQNRRLCGIRVVRAEWREPASVLAVGVVDARGGIRTAVAPIGVRDGIGVVGIRAQAAEIPTISGDDFRGRGGVGIRDARGRKRTAECAVGIVDTR